MINPLIFGHGGDVNQFHSLMQLAPEHNLGVFVSFNSDPGSVSITSKLCCTCFTSPIS